MEKEAIWIDGPPEGVELAETTRHHLSPPAEDVIVVTYQRVDIPLATCHKVIKRDGSEKWCMLRPKKAFFPVAHAPDITTLKESAVSNGIWRKAGARSSPTAI